MPHSCRYEVWGHDREKSGLAVDLSDDTSTPSNAPREQSLRLLFAACGAQRQHMGQRQYTASEQKAQRRQQQRVTEDIRTVAALMHQIDGSAGKQAGS
jgi:hypothetical protein